MKIAPKNWRKFQHYKHRNPPWIRLHRSLLDDYDFQCLQLASKALAPMLWLLASQEADGVIKASEGALAFRLRMSLEDFRPAFKQLVDKGFFTSEMACKQDASNMLAPCKQSSSTETETETETEKKEEDTAHAVSSYAFESGIIRLSEKSLGLWTTSFSYLDVRAELVGLADWANQQGDRWFHAVAGALAKRNREAKLSGKANGKTPIPANMRAAIGERVGKHVWNGSRWAEYEGDHGSETKA